MRVRPVTRKAVASPAKRAVRPSRLPNPSKPPATKGKPKKPTVRVFVSYCHANASAQAKLQIHLAQLKRDEVDTWFDGDMDAGDKLSTEISRKLRSSDVFVALMSPEYIASHWCQLEYKRAMGRRAAGAMRVVVVIVRPCDWKATGASELKVLPRDGRPVSGWRTADDAFNDVTQGIRGVVRAVRASMAEAARAKPVTSIRPAAATKPKKPAGVVKAASTGRGKAGAGVKHAGNGRPTRNRVHG